MGKNTIGMRRFLAIRSLMTSKKQKATVRITFADSRKRSREMYVADSEAEKTGGRMVAGRGRKPKSYSRLRADSTYTYWRPVDKLQHSYSMISRSS